MATEQTDTPVNVGSTNNNPKPAGTTVGASTAELPDRTLPKISKAQAKKDAKKEAKREMKKELSNDKAPAQKKSVPEKTTNAKNARDQKSTSEDSDSMFRVGFLADVYKERPLGSKGTEKVITRCKSWVDAGP